MAAGGVVNLALDVGRRQIVHIIQHSINAAELLKEGHEVVVAVAHVVGAYNGVHMSSQAKPCVGRWACAPRHSAMQEKENIIKRMS